MMSVIMLSSIDRFFVFLVVYIVINLNHSIKLVVGEDTKWDELLNRLGKASKGPGNIILPHGKTAGNSQLT
jgi:hypothetical protein